MKKHSFRIGFFSFLAIFLYPAVCFARTYFVWNEFDATVDAFKTLGLVMSDPRYQGCFFGIIVIGFVFGGISAFFSAHAKGGDPLKTVIRWFGIFIIGVAIYLTFIKPTTSMTIWDQATNQQTTLGGIPVGIEFLAILSNTIETNFVSLIAQANPNPAMAYTNNAGGLSFTIFDNLFNGGINFSGDTTNTEMPLYNSLSNYFQKCVYTEMSLPNPRIVPNDFENTTNFMTTLARANSPAVFTTYYNSSSPGGQTMTCQQAWTNISGDLNGLVNTSIPVINFWKNGCSAAGLSGTSGGINEQQVCYNKAQAAENVIFGATFTSSQIFRQYFIAQMMWNVITSNSPASATQALSSRAAGNSMVGMGIMANQWIPIMRGVMFSIFIGMLPFLCLLVPTPLFGKALSYIFGIFTFFLCWSVCDALVNDFASSRAMDIFASLQSGMLGYQSMLLFSSASQKSLAMYGAARWTGLLLAGTLTTLLTKFGGMGMTHFAMGISSARQYGASAANTMINPSDWSNKIKQMGEVYPSMTYANAGLPSYGGALTQRAEKTLSSANAMRQTFGSDFQAGKHIGRFEGEKTANTVNANEEILGSNAGAYIGGFQGKEQAGKINTIKQRGDLDRVAQNVGIDAGASAVATSDVTSAMGIDTLIDTKEVGQYFQVAQGAGRQSLNDIITHGQQTDEDRDMFSLLNDSKEGAAAVKAALSNLSAPVPNGDEHNIGTYLRKHGANISDQELKGATVAGSFSTDSNGNLIPSMITVSKGDKSQSFDLHSTDTGIRKTTGTRIDSGYVNKHSNLNITDTGTRHLSGNKGEIHGSKPGNYGGEILVAVGTISWVGSGENKIATMKGVDNKGLSHDMSLLMNSSDPSKWIKLYDDVKSTGKTFSGNLINSALNMREDDDVLNGKDMSATVNYTNGLASQLSKVLSKQEQYSDVHQVINSWARTLGARFDSSSTTVGKLVSAATGGSVSGGISSSHESRHTQTNSSSSNRDAIATAYRTIAMSDLPDQEKREMIQDMTRYMLGDRDIAPLSRNRAGSGLGGPEENRSEWKQPINNPTPILPVDPGPNPNEAIENYDRKFDPRLNDKELNEFRNNIEIKPKKE